jgi:hypothetical protein
MKAGRAVVGGSPNPGRRSTARALQRVVPGLLVVLLALATTACGDDGTSTSAVSPRPFSTPTIGPDWVEVTTLSGAVELADTWVRSPLFRIDDEGTIRAVGYLEPAVEEFGVNLAAGPGGTRGTTALGGPTPGFVEDGRCHFDIVSATPVRPGLYRFEVTSAEVPCTYELTIYLKP